MAGYQPGWIVKQELRFQRRLELLRGSLLRIRGAIVGKRFGIGRAVRFLYPDCFRAGDDVTIGDYSYLHCLSQRGVIIGNSTSIDRNLWLHCGGQPGNCEHGFFVIGNHSFIGCSAVMGAGGGIVIGDHVQIGQSVNFHAEDHQFSDPSLFISEQGVRYQGIVVEDDVWIGSQVVVLDGVRIGRGCVIGAGSVVTKSIDPWSVAVGVPAKVIKSRREQA
jgi:acetyltransferase-like isoleucine patch superfamily enzyme